MRRRWKNGSILQTMIPTNRSYPPSDEAKKGELWDYKRQKYPHAVVAGAVKKRDELTAKLGWRPPSEKEHRLLKLLDEVING